MDGNEVALAELRFLEAHLTHRARICYAMVSAGIIYLAAGVATLVAGLSGDQVAWFQSGNLRITAGGFGDFQRVVNFDAKISHRTLQLGIAKQELNGAKVLRTLVNQRSLSSPHRMGAVNR